MTPAPPALAAGPRPYWEGDGITVYCARWQDVLPLSCDVVITDPPYGTGGWRRGESGAGSNPSASLIRETWDTGATDWLAATRVDRVLTFWPVGGAAQLLNAATALGLDKHRALYFRKRDPKPVLDRTRWSMEPIWVLSAGGFVLRGEDDVFEGSTPRLGRDHEATGHPYQKPLALMLWLLSKVDEGTILDPFAGSGTTLVAGRILGRRCIGIEQDERWCEVTVQRIRAATEFGARRPKAAPGALDDLPLFSSEISR
jgi:site-specific DNA-methyltransferase (adenine-specific)